MKSKTDQCYLHPKSWPSLAIR